jgi:heat shock protein HslJ
MAGDKFDYSVTIDYKRTGDSDYKTFKGCGTYVPDFRLHDIWAIIEVDGKKIDASSFKEKAPMMEINITNNTVSGSNGCNNFSGGVRTENGKVIFTPLASTLRDCIDNQEISSKISTVLSGNTLNYKFENNLVLYKNGIRVMVLKHID